MNISIERVLAQIKSGNEGVFTIGFVRASGKSQGTIKTVKALYGAPKPNGDKAAISPRKVHTHKEAGTLPLTDHDTGDYITPLISHIILFNNYKVYH
jgi:hypothetical protein